MVFEIFYSLACNWSDFSAAMLLLVESDDSFKPCVRKMDCLMLSEVLQCCSQLHSKFSVCSHSVSTACCMQS